MSARYNCYVIDGERENHCEQLLDCEILNGATTKIYDCKTFNYDSWWKLICGICGNADFRHFSFLAMP